jgi:hypothetical protein
MLAHLRADPAALKIIPLNSAEESDLLDVNGPVPK